MTDKVTHTWDADKKLWIEVDGVNRYSHCPTSNAVVSRADWNAYNEYVNKMQQDDPDQYYLWQQSDPYAWVHEGKIPVINDPPAQQELKIDQPASEQKTETAPAQSEGHA